MYKLKAGGRPLVMRHPVMADPTGPLQQYILSWPRCGVAAEFTELTKSWATILWLLACEDFAMPFGPGRRDPFHCVTAGGRAYLRRRDCATRR